jgi:hypothetical protein
MIHWELEVEYVRGSYLCKLWYQVDPLRGWTVMLQQRYLNVWEAIERIAYAAVIYPLKLN